MHTLIQTPNPDTTMKCAGSLLVILSHIPSDLLNWCRPLSEKGIPIAVAPLRVVNWSCQMLEELDGDKSKAMT